MVDSEIALAKTGHIQRCLKRISDVTHLDPASLHELDTQDILF